jgi:hypothetical protein
VILGRDYFLPRIVFDKKGAMMARNRRKFAWRTPHFYQGIDPDEVARELEDIKEENGLLTPSLVVERARDSMSVLHACFEWNDTTAAEKYRLQQARTLILNVQVIVKHSEPQIFLVQIENKEGKKTYEDVELVTEEAACLVMANALKDLKAWMKRYNELKDRLPLSKVFSAVDEALRQTGAQP